jgi:hypothetical protein
MEPRKVDTSVEARGEGPALARPQPEKKRRFQIVRLEERVAPCGHGQQKKTNCGSICYGRGGC